MVLPYGVAFKLVAVIGLLALPVARLGLRPARRLPFPAPALLAVAAVAFLFDRRFTIYGGNIASTLAGEFAFSISLSFALSTSASCSAASRPAATGRWPPCCSALSGLCHLIPAIFALVGAGVAFAMRTGTRPGCGGWPPVRRGRRALRRSGPCRSSGAGPT